jgi:hypothetical protein
MARTGPGIADRQHFDIAGLKRAGYLFAPPVARLKRHNVGKDGVASSLQARREPQCKFVVARRGFTNENHRASGGVSTDERLFVSGLPKFMGSSFDEKIRFVESKIRLDGAVTNRTAEAREVEGQPTANQV